MRNIPQLSRSFSFSVSISFRLPSLYFSMHNPLFGKVGIDVCIIKHIDSTHILASVWQREREGGKKIRLKERKRERGSEKRQ